jgi:hypothetical protein
VVGYEPGGSSTLTGASPLRTRCPGPLLSGASSLATGRVPRSDLRRPGFTVSLRGGPSRSDDGYDLSVSGRLRLTFRRGRVTQQLETLP